MSEQPTFEQTWAYIMRKWIEGQGFTKDEKMTKHVGKPVYGEWFSKDMILLAINFSTGYCQIMTGTNYGGNRMLFCGVIHGEKELEIILQCIQRSTELESK